MPRLGLVTRRTSSRRAPPGTMRLCAPQRQRLPSRARRTAASSASGSSSSSAAAVDQHPRGAVAALQRLLLDERSCSRCGRPSSPSPSTVVTCFRRRPRPGCRRSAPGARRPARCRRRTRPRPAAELAPDQPEVVAQHVEQAGVGVAVDLVARAVDDERHGRGPSQQDPHGSSSSATKACIHCAASRRRPAGGRPTASRASRSPTASAPVAHDGSWRAAPTARIAACGGLMIAANSSTPYMPRLVTVTSRPRARPGGAGRHGPGRRGRASPPATAETVSGLDAAEHRRHEPALGGDGDRDVDGVEAADGVAASRSRSSSGTSWCAAPTALTTRSLTETATSAPSLSSRPQRQQLVDPRGAPDVEVRRLALALGEPRRDRPAHPRVRHVGVRAAGAGGRGGPEPARGPPARRRAARHGAPAGARRARVAEPASACATPLGQRGLDVAPDDPAARAGADRSLTGRPGLLASRPGQRAGEDRARRRRPARGARARRRGRPRRPGRRAVVRGARRRARQQRVEVVHLLARRRPSTAIGSPTSTSAPGGDQGLQRGRRRPRPRRRRRPCRSRRSRSRVGRETRSSPRPATPTAPPRSRSAATSGIRSSRATSVPRRSR